MIHAIVLLFKEVIKFDCGETTRLSSTHSCHHVKLYKFWCKSYENIAGKFPHKLQSNQVKCTPQEAINEFIIQKLNPLLVVDFRLISAFLYV